VGPVSSLPPHHRLNPIPTSQSFSRSLWLLLGEDRCLGEEPEGEEPEEEERRLGEEPEGEEPEGEEPEGEERRPREEPEGEERRPREEPEEEERRPREEERRPREEEERRPREEEERRAECSLSCQLVRFSNPSEYSCGKSMQGGVPVRESGSSKSHSKCAIRSSDTSIKSFTSPPPRMVTISHKNQRSSVWGTVDTAPPSP